MDRIGWTILGLWALLWLLQVVAAGGIGAWLAKLRTDPRMKVIWGGLFVGVLIIVWLRQA